MKKLLTLLFLFLNCFYADISFANAENNNLIKPISIESTKTLMFCTVTHTVYWYNEYGVYLGSISSTVTWGADNSGINCAMAQHIAQVQAESMAL